MWRQTAIAALCATVLVVPSWAQMRGSFRGSAPAPMGRGGFTPRGPVGVRSGPVFGGMSQSGVRFGGGLHQSFIGSRQSFAGFRRPFLGFRQPFFGPRHFHHRVFFSTFSPWFFGYYGYPGYPGLYSDYSYSTLGSYPAYDYSSAYSAQNDISRQQQDIDRLEDEVARLREERESREAPSSKPQAQGKSEPSTPTVLVFRDKHTQEVQNYAVVGGTLWIFNEQRATKLPLSWLDIDATAKANEERGVDFRIPK